MTSRFFTVYDIVHWYSEDRDQPIWGSNRYPSDQTGNVAAATGAEPLRAT